MIKKSEIRKHYLIDKYVIITPGRAARPRDIKEETVMTRTGDCPFCPAHISRANVLDETLGDNGWAVLSIKNIFPAVTIDNEQAYGVQEVIIETPDHIKELAHLSEHEIALVLAMYARRTAALAANSRLEYILCLKNQGSKAGASIVHAHSQILATHILPPDIQAELAAAQAYRVEKRTCPYCDILKREMKSDRRIWEDANAAAFTPYASDFHYEAWIFTKRHLDNITKLNEAEISSLARVLKKILLKLEAIDLSFNFFLHQVVSDHDQHFYLKIQPRASVWGGVELGSGLVINSIPPEEAARYYRE